MVVAHCPVEGCDYTATANDGDVVAGLLHLHATVHKNGNAGRVATARAEKLKRLMISRAGTSEEWAYFVTRWTEYKKGTKLAGADVVIQLLECCNEELRKDLTRSAGGTVTGKTEAEVLTGMKALAVRSENTMVARVSLYNMRQDRDEAIRSFGAQIKGQVGVCKYMIECARCKTAGNPCDIDYTEAILRDVLARGIAD